MGWGVACLVASVFGLSTFAALLFEAVKGWWIRIVFCAFLILGYAIILESMR